MDPEERYAAVTAIMKSRAGIKVTVPKKRGLSSALCINDKIFAMFSPKGQLVVKLPKERVRALTLAGRGSYFEWSHGQPMQEWFVAGLGLDDEWLCLAKEALLFVAGELAPAPEAVSVAREPSLIPSPQA
jgi:hypothetical protein